MANFAINSFNSASPHTPIKECWNRFTSTISKTAACLARAEKEVRNLYHRMPHSILAAHVVCIGAELFTSSPIIPSPLFGMAVTNVFLTAYSAGIHQCKLQSLLTAMGEDESRVFQLLIEEVGGLELVKDLIDRGVDVSLLLIDLCNGLPDDYENKKLEIFQYLLDRGVDTAPLNSWGQTPLHLAVIYKKAAFVEALINKGADTNVQDGNGKTPLMWACNSSEKTVQILLDNHASVHLKDDEGNTALHYAARFHNPKAIAQLLEKNADINALNRDGATPLIALVKDARLEEELPSFVEIAKLLKNCNLDAKDSIGRTALHYAVYDQVYYNLTRELLVLGANPNIQNKEGHTPLMVVCNLQENKPEWVELLLKMGAQVHFASPDSIFNEFGELPFSPRILCLKQTALDLALFRPKPCKKTISALLQRKAPAHLNSSPFFFTIGDKKRSLQFFRHEVNALLRQREINQRHPQPPDPLIEVTNEPKSLDSFPNHGTGVSLERTCWQLVPPPSFYQENPQ